MKSCYIYLLIGLISCTAPKAGFKLSQEKKSAPSQIIFENQSTKAESYLWDFGDGSTTDIFSPVHRYVESGRYQVKLHATKNKKTNTFIKEVFVGAPTQCLIEIKTSVGNMTALLYDDTPLHRDNFLNLINQAYYNDILFHRVIKGFMAQTGDPESKDAPSGKELGTGGPNYTIPAEMNDTCVHVKGALAAARFPDHVNPKKESSGSQFYIVHGKATSEEQLETYEFQKNIRYRPIDKEIMQTKGGAPQLDMEYTVFGRVIDGIEVIDEICRNSTDKRDRPLADIKIISINIIK